MRVDAVEGQDERLRSIELVEVAVIVVVGKVDRDDLVDLVVLEQCAQRRVVEVAAFDVVVAVDVIALK